MPEFPPGSADDGTLAVLQAMLTTFTEVLDGMDRRLGTMEGALRSLQADDDRAGELRQALARLDRVEGIEADLAEIRALLVDHPAATVHDAVAALTAQVGTLVAQPGPGPAMAMVAAGLAERFEQRTQGLVELLREHAELMHALTEQVQAAMQGLVAAVEGRQAGLDALLDTVRVAAGTIEGMGESIEDARDGIDAVFQAGKDLPAAVGSLRDLEQKIRQTALMIEDQSVVGLTEVVREESELLAQRLAAVAVSLELVRTMLAGLVEESAHSIGRKASSAGRRLVADLGLASRSRERSRPPLGGVVPPPPPPPLAGSAAEPPPRAAKKAAPKRVTKNAPAPVRKSRTKR
ncbi:MAG: hypothetical protein ABIS21_08140 [Acidimicrobiales bacterium]